MMKPSIVSLCFCFTLLPFNPRLANARPAPSVQESLIDARLEKAHRQARIWHWSWVGIFGAGIAAQGVLTGFAQNDKGRWAAGLQAIAPATGLTLQLVAPLDSLELPRDLAHIRETKLEPKERLRAKKALLARYARSERKQRNWFAHAGPIFLNASLAALLLLATDKPLEAGVQLGAGILVSELNVWTSPTAASEPFETKAPQLGVTPVLSFGYFGLAGHF
jgi:hypothetical protein